MRTLELDDPHRPDVLRLLEEHLADMYAISPPESVHALDPTALTRPEVSFWTVRDAGTLLGCGALKQWGVGQGEVKSMRTTAAARGRGVATELLTHVVGEARRRGYRALSLETGREDYFAPARRLYARHGFLECAPFGDYLPDPNSVFLRLELAARPFTDDAG